MDTRHAQEFAVEWVANWNTHDLEAILAHFADDVVFTSGVAARVVPESGGVIRGKSALRDYWTVALARVPELRFELIGVYLGLDTVVINYRNHAGNLACEVLTFADGVVRTGHGTYLSDDAAGASGVTSPVPR